MNKKLLSVIMVAGLIALLASCSDNVVEAGDEAVQSSAKLNVRVLDVITNEPVKGASVTIMENGSGSKTTDENGFAYAGNARLGSQALLVSAPEYATIMQQVEVSEGAGDDISIALVQTEVVYMFPLKATLEGNVFYNNKEGAALPAKGAKVVVTYSANEVLVVLPPDTLTVDENGKFTKSNLPAEVKAKINVLDYDTSDSKTLKGKQSAFTSPTLKVNVVTVAGTYTYSEGLVGSPLYIVTDNDTEIESGANAFTVTFNDVVDTEKGKITATELISANVLPQPNATWAADKKSVTLVFEGIKLYKDFKVCFEGLTSAKGITSGPCEEFYVKIPDLTSKQVELVSATPSVAVTALTEVPITATVVWKDLEGATSYEIYAKATDSKKNTWVKVTPSAISSSGTAPNITWTATVSLNSDLGFPKTTDALDPNYANRNRPFSVAGSKIDIKVLGVGGGSNNTNKTKLENTTSVKSIAP